MRLEWLGFDECLKRFMVALLPNWTGVSEAAWGGGRAQDVCDQMEMSAPSNEQHTTYTAF